MILYNIVKGGMTASQVALSEDINKAVISRWKNNLHKIQKVALSETCNHLASVRSSKGGKKRRE